MSNTNEIARLTIERDTALAECSRLRATIARMEPNDGAPSRGRILDIIRNAFGPKAGHGSCVRAAKGERVCQICCAMNDLREIAKVWKGGIVSAAVVTHATGIEA